ncbi:hypothetical protein RB619_08045 [Flavobacterium sp. LHD-80]|uniref:hypothetical protein n=1 Tax=unclassified Flavobacterium TaxID=196869 RepID=UPI0027DFB16F|nr:MULTISPECIES: hypothetical protein [unclassified Flavobacterium]MDQ6470589.1 hypothetical protein [Flavobacterium sp. LHD-80]MDQ6532168.1 hypothetical protein [Flavobacterium sp. LHD-85]
MGGDFLANLKDTALLVRSEHGVTFALEIGQTAYWFFDKKQREAIEILWKKYNEEEKNKQACA